MFGAPKYIDAMLGFSLFKGNVLTRVIKKFLQIYKKVLNVLKNAKKQRVLKECLLCPYIAFL